MKKILVMVLVLLLSVSILAGCGGGDTKLSGKYAMTAYELNGQDLLEMLKMFGGEDYDANSLFIEFTDNGKFTLEADDVTTGTFYVDGKKLTLTVDGESMTGTVNGNKVTIEANEDGNTMKMVFEKK